MNTVFNLPMGCCQRPVCSIQETKPDGQSHIWFGFSLARWDEAAVKFYGYNDLAPLNSFENRVELMRMICAADRWQAQRDIFGMADETRDHDRLNYLRKMELQIEAALAAPTVIPLAIRVTTARSTSELLGRAA